MPTYDGGYGGRDTTSRNPNKKPARVVTAGAGQGRVQQQLYSAGYRPATNSEGRSVDQQYAWDPSRSQFATTASLQRDSLRAAGMLPGQQQPSAPSYGGGGGGGGGYGGGGGSAFNYAAYEDAMRQLLGSSLMKPTPNPMAGKIDPAVQADLANAQAAYGGLASQVSMTDPYLQLVAAQAPQLGNEMGAFLQGQGLGTGTYDQAVQAQNAQLQAGQQNWQNLAAVLGQNHLAAQQGVKDVAGLQSQNIQQGITAQGQALNAQLAMQQYQAQEAAKQQQLQIIMQLISQGASMGKTPNLAGLL